MVDKNKKKALLILVILCSMSLLLSACGGGGGGGGVATAGPNIITMSGNAFNGPIRGGIVNVYHVDDAGRRTGASLVIGQCKTSENDCSGAFNCTVIRPSGPVVIEVTPSPDNTTKYCKEFNINKIDQLPDGTKLSAIFTQPTEDNVTNLIITPFTTVAVNIVPSTPGNTLAEKIIVANQKASSEVNLLFNLTIDITKDSPHLTNAYKDALLFVSSLKDNLKTPTVNSIIDNFTAVFTDNASQSFIDNFTNTLGKITPSTTFSIPDYVTYKNIIRDSTPPSPPTNVSAVALDTSRVTVHWSASTDNNGVAGYDVYMNGVLQSTTNNTQFQKTALSANTQYCFYIKAYDYAGNRSSQSPTVCATTPVQNAPPPSTINIGGNVDIFGTPDTELPTAPSNVAATAISAIKINLTWTASTDNRGISHYMILMSGVNTDNTTATNFTKENLTPSTTYCFKVRAVDTSGNISAESSQVCATTQSAVTLSIGGSVEIEDDIMQLSGEAVNGPINNGIVKVHRLLANGSLGDLLNIGECRTNYNGFYNCTIRKDLGPIKVIISPTTNSTYYNLVTKTIMPLPQTIQITAVKTELPQTGTKLIATPFTTVAAEIIAKDNSTTTSIEEKIVMANEKASQLVESLVGTKIDLVSVSPLEGTTKESNDYKAALMISTQLVNVITSTDNVSTQPTTINTVIDKMASVIMPVGVDSNSKQELVQTFIAQVDNATKTLTSAIDNGSITGVTIKPIDNASILQTLEIISDTISPSVPTNLSISVIGTSKMVLSWSASSDNKAVAGYTIFVNGVERSATASLSYMLDNLTVGTTLCFKLKAFDTAGNRSDFSQEACKTIEPLAPITIGGNVDISGLPDTEPPMPPTNVTASATATTKIALNWSAAIDNKGIASYDIYIGANKIASTTSTSYLAETLQPSTNYCFRVKSVDTSGNQSGLSADACATTLTAPLIVIGGSVDISALPDTEPPTAPTGITVQGLSTTRLLINWLPATDNKGVQGYAILLSGNQIATTTSTNIELDGLTASTTYCFKIKAIDIFGNQSPLSIETCGTTLSPYANMTIGGSVDISGLPDTEPPTAPSNLSVVVNSSSKVTLTWLSSTDNKGLNHYIIYMQGSQIGTTTNTDFVKDGLTASTNYCFTVKAVDTSNNLSVDSNQVCITTIEAQPLVLSGNIVN